MGAIFFPAVTECGFGEPGAHTSSELQLLYLIARVGQSIPADSISALNNTNFFYSYESCPYDIMSCLFTYPVPEDLILSLVPWEALCTARCYYSCPSCHHKFQTQNQKDLCSH